MLIYDLTYDALLTFMLEHGFKKYRTDQVWHWLYQQKITQFNDMKNVPKEIIDLLSEHFRLEGLELVLKHVSQDGTMKCLYALHDGHLIESVLMRQHYGNSICVTTQVGCNLGCSFCASGLLTKSRDLSSGEIVEQLIMVQQHLDTAAKDEKVTNVVVMGIGEPFDNFDNLVGFLRVIIDYKGLAIGSRHITVSTSGLVDQIVKFADLDLQVNLAVSLHAPNNELRSRIMKINRAIPIETLMQAIDYYYTKTNQKITVAYILLKDINDRLEHAAQLADLIDDRRGFININLIPYNPVDEHSEYQRSEQESVMAFYDALKKQGVKCSVRLEHGTDIDAACGQLRSKQMKEVGAS
jgi:23S rRNA (adenine2503-C2)-methyltransferase